MSKGAESSSVLNDLYHDNRFYFTLVGLVLFFIILLFQRVHQKFYICHICFIVGAILMFFLQSVCEFPNRPEMDCLLNEQLKLVCIILMIYTVFVFHIYMKKVFSQAVGHRMCCADTWNYDGYSLIMALALVCTSISFCFTFSLRCESYTKDCVCETDLVQYNFGDIIRLTLIVISSLYGMFLLLYIWHLFEMLKTNDYIFHPTVASFVFTRFLWFLFHFVFSVTPLYMFSIYANAHDYSDFFKIYAFILWISLSAATPSNKDLETLGNADLLVPLETSLVPILLETTVCDEWWKTGYDIKTVVPKRDMSSDTYDIDESGIVPMNLSPTEPRPRESIRSGMSVGSILKTLRPADVPIEKADSTHKNPSLKDDATSVVTSEGGDLLSVMSCDKSVLSYGGSRMDSTPPNSDYDIDRKGSHREVQSVRSIAESQVSLRETIISHPNSPVNPKTINLNGYVRFPDDSFHDVQEREIAKAEFSYLISNGLESINDSVRPPNAIHLLYCAKAISV